MLTGWEIYILIIHNVDELTGKKFELHRLKNSIEVLLRQHFKGRKIILTRRGRCNGVAEVFFNEK